MTSLFVDIWHDLREKRLWPAAVALLAAIVAVPVVLFKPASDAAPPSTAAPHGSKVPTLPVVHVDGGPLLGSHLEAFSASEKNPFKPMKDLAKTDTGTSGASASTAGGAGSAAGSASGGTGGTGGTAGGSGGSASGSAGSTGGTPSSGGTTSTTTKTTQWFHYVADFNFGKSGEKPTSFKSKAAYTLLPDEKTPVVVFLGLSADHKTALFFLSDAAYEAQGEGSCVGSGACTFVTLSMSDTGDEETFSSLDGSVSYDLQLLKIRRESLGSGSQPTTPSTPSSPKKGKAAADAGAGVAAAANSASEAALPAVFVDGPSVAATQQK